MATESIPVLENILESYSPAEPIQRIHEQRDIDEFMKTKAFDRIMTFVMLLNQSVMQKKISDPCFVSPVRLIKI
jgi:serine/threonine-protein phosphatase 2A activator